MHTAAPLSTLTALASSTGILTELWWVQAVAQTSPATSKLFLYKLWCHHCTIGDDQLQAACGCRKCVTPYYRICLLSNMVIINIDVSNLHIPVLCTGHNSWTHHIAGVASVTASKGMHRCWPSPKSIVVASSHRVPDRHEQQLWS